MSDYLFRIQHPVTLCARITKQNLQMVALFAILLHLTGCAYHFGAVKRNIPGSYDRVSVPVFKNRTPEVGLEAYFTKSMVEEIERGHIASVVGRDDSQVVIEGEIIDVQYNRGATINKEAGFANMPEDTELAKEYRIVVTTVVKVRRRSDDTVIWEGSFSNERRYPAPQITREAESSMNPLYNHSSRHQNIELMAKDLMAEAYSNMTENF